jgi:hypothetical protein
MQVDKEKHVFKAGSTFSNVIELLGKGIKLSDASGFLQ